MAEVSIRKFARREGGSEGTVRQAIKAGRLAAALADGSLDPGLIRGVRRMQLPRTTGTHPRPCSACP
ncbi:hypothetical protein [Paraburkholderia sp. Cpub6]|uniref:hypothetical protein n=1 Tax=Paraburkholderia sp. Cpub6 TaxID=2723094 RepID=UPI00161319D8|nr:hypothetical protein [Paraburkholderia sp. Cpub6]MBB5457757.1 hypothetical protein [Paraburkholderia sp. Cpub6]